MPSSNPTRPSRRRWHALAVATATLVVAACSAGGANPTPPDATGLISTISTSLAAVHQVDAHLTLSGTLTSGADGGATAAAGASAAAPVTLDGTVLDVKSDTTNASADISLTLPTGIAGGGTSEVIVVGSDIYLKLGPLGSALGLPDDGTYHHTTTSTLAGLGGVPVTTAAASADPSQVAQALGGLQDVMAGLAQAPTVTAVTCGSASCWDLHVVLGPADLAALAAKGASALASAMPLGPLPTGDLAGIGGVTVDIIARQDDGRPSEVKAVVDGGPAGTATADLTLAFDTPLAINTPPASSVVEGFPGLTLP